MTSSSESSYRPDRSARSSAKMAAASRRFVKPPRPPSKFPTPSLEMRSNNSNEDTTDAKNALLQIAGLILKISGDVPAVQKGLEEIGCQLRENPPRQVISLSPAYNYTGIRPPQVQPYVDPTSAEYITFEMMISETMVGGLIGRCGSNISRIRNETGTMIKVYGGKGEDKLRQIQFCGNAQQVLLAKQWVDEYIYSQLIQQAGAQQTAESSCIDAS